MPYAIDRKGMLDLAGNSAEYEFDVGAHTYTRLVYVARATNGSVRLRAWKLEADGSFTSAGNEHVVGSGTRTRIVVFDNHRIVVVWLGQNSALRARGYIGTANGMLEGGSVTVETTITNFDLVAVGVTTGVQQPNPDNVVYYAYRHFALTMLSANGGWKLQLGTVLDSADVSLGPVSVGGPGDRVALSCASLNEIVDGAHPRKALTLWRDAGQIKTRSWRVAGAGVTLLATAAESKALGIGVVHGMSIGQNNDIFATVVWPGASNDTSRLQLLSVAADGAMTAYATAEIAQIPVFARLRHHGTDAAVAYRTGDGHLAVAAWRFAAPGGSGAARTVLASKVGVEQPTQVRLATLVPSDADDPVPIVTLSRVAAGALRLVSWRLKKTVLVVASGPFSTTLAMAKDTLQSLAGHVGDRAMSAVATSTRKDPVRAVLVAAGVGAVLMSLLATMARSGARRVERRVRRRRQFWS